MGRRVFILYPPISKGNIPVIREVQVLKFRRVLPAGPVASGEAPSADGIRAQHLIQIYTDPGGMRTVAVADLHLKNPRKRFAEELEKASA